MNKIIHAFPINGRFKQPIKHFYLTAKEYRQGIFDKDLLLDLKDFECMDMENLPPDIRAVEKLKLLEEVNKSFFCVSFIFGVTRLYQASSNGGYQCLTFQCNNKFLVNAALDAKLPYYSSIDRQVKNLPTSIKPPKDETLTAIEACIFEYGDTFL